MSIQIRRQRAAVCGAVRMLACAGLLLLASRLHAGQTLPLDAAVAIAQGQDPWLSGSQLREEASVAQGIAAGQLPDPMVSFDFANLPMNDLDFNQEPMTQLRVGVRQTFPRGDSLALRQQQFDELGAEQPYLRQDRRAKVRASVSQLWLEVFRHRESIRLIEQDRALFEHLVDVAESAYSTALGKTRQQDVVRAQLELTRLDERLSVLQQQREASHAMLGEWLHGAVASDYVLAAALPEIPVDASLPADISTGAEELLPVLLGHPLILSIDQKIAASGTGVELARQKYQPEWGVNAGYGYRDDDPMGNNRSDFFSIGLTFDLPLFPAQRQDREVAAAVASAEALRTDRMLALRSMRAGFEAARSRLFRLDERRQLYAERLLREIHDQAEAALGAYTSDAGDFAEVVRARIAELNANIDFLNINIDRLKTIAEINYFLAQASLESDMGDTP